MRRVLTTTAAATALLLATAAGDTGHAGASAGAGQPVDLAIIGDIPYGPARIAAFPADIAQINTDPTVSQVVHLGDIKNGSSRCDTSYFEQIRADFDQFEDPLIYTPGDNEWTDCHRASNGGYQPAGRQIDGAPIVTPGPSRLDEVRRIFFDRPGRTLGRDPLRVDAQGGRFVENVAWSAARVQFGVLNVPGSNNDLLPWFGVAETPQLAQLQQREYERRNRADLRWLERIFSGARRTHARAVVLGIQADMWDPAITGDPVQYSGFTDLVRSLARQARAFGRPVLLLNGDSHVYESDTPLADPAATNATIYGVPVAVPNLRRVTVDGSDNADDYLRLHVDPRTAGVFSWERVPFTTTIPVAAT